MAVPVRSRVVRRGRPGVRPTQSTPGFVRIDEDEVACLERIASAVLQGGGVQVGPGLALVLQIEGAARVMDERVHPGDVGVGQVDGARRYAPDRAARPKLFAHGPGLGIVGTSDSERENHSVGVVYRRSDGPPPGSSRWGERPAGAAASLLAGRRGGGRRRPDGAARYPLMKRGEK